MSSKYDHLIPEMERLRGEGYGWNRIAETLGLPHANTALRLLRPDYAERQRILSREAKRRRARPCATSGCQNLAKYAGQGGDGVSTYCRECASRMGGEWNRAHAFTRDQAILILQAFADEHGRPPTSRDFYPHGVGRGMSHATAYRLFGSWPAALEAAGLPVTRRYTKREKAAA